MVFDITSITSFHDKFPTLDLQPFVTAKHLAWKQRRNNIRPPLTINYIARPGKFFQDLLKLLARYHPRAKSENPQGRQLKFANKAMDLFFSHNRLYRWLAQA